MLRARTCQALGSRDASTCRLLGSLGVAGLAPPRSGVPDGRILAATSLVRGDTRGRLNLDRCAQELGVSVRIGGLRSPLDGLTTSDHDVAIRRGLTKTHHQFVLAHELAHVLVRRGRCSVPARGAWTEEAFADAFARELILPVAAVVSTRSDALLDMQREHGASTATLLLQMALAGSAPALMRCADGLVLCVDCGTRLGPPTCVCRKARERAA
jgi:hypothetical protein